MLVYMAIGALVMFLMVCTEASKASLRKSYIEYRSDAIAAGDNYLNEIVFRRMLVSFLFVVSMLLWPLIIGYGIIKVLFRK